MRGNGVRLAAFREYGKTKHFALSPAEADAFCEAWAAYRTDQKAKQEAEEKRTAEMIAEAYSIARDYPAIIIKESKGSDSNGNTVPAWDVSIPNIALYWDPERFLERVTQARDAWLDYQKRTKEAQ